MQNPQPLKVVDFIYVIGEGESNPFPDITPTFFPRIDGDHCGELRASLFLMLRLIRTCIC